MTFGQHFLVKTHNILHFWILTVAVYQILQLSTSYLHLLLSIEENSSRAPLIMTYNDVARKDENYDC
ncbi:hypothetical protein CICLE_v10029759mg [Citrus x clementina]|uniref:Uncharacterized protein n=1 Tax=Citrus clementina TaxID=85681 RepID=V4SGS9_CITCL|nr:hypothetical protein CICLE_v10029759mg [Citrus x clementina]